jgi:RNA polymerase sigma-70 factor (ECF subfamily)
VIGPGFGELLDAARDGDERAFAALWRDLNPALLRYLRVLAPASTEDTAAEVWLDVCRGLGRFGGPETSFRAWVFTVARMRAVDAGRQAARRPVRPIPPELLPEGPAPDDPAEAAVEAQATHDALALIATLPPAQAEVVVLRVIAGLDTVQVGEIVGKSPGAVRVLAHRGLRRLAQRLTERTGV